MPAPSDNLAMPLPTSQELNDLFAGLEPENQRNLIIALTAITNALANQVDRHDHDKPKVPSTNIDFTGDSTDFSSQKILNAKSISFANSQSDDVNAPQTFYVKNGDVWFKDGSGADIKITHNGKLDNIILNIDTGGPTLIYHGWLTGQAVTASQIKDYDSQNLITAVNAVSLGVLAPSGSNSLYLGGAVRATPPSTGLMTGNFYYPWIAIEKRFDSGLFKIYLENYGNDDTHLWVDAEEETFNVTVGQEQVSKTYRKKVRTVPFKYIGDNKFDNDDDDGFVPEFILHTFSS